MKIARAPAARRATTVALGIGMFLLAACGGKASAYCGRVERLSEIETAFDVTTLSALQSSKPPGPDVVKKFIEAFVTTFGEIKAVALPEISDDVATLWEAANKTQTELREVGYNVARADESEDLVVGDARSRFDAFNAEECSVRPGLTFEPQVSKR